MTNIFNHNRLPFNFMLDRSEYWDFYLYQGSFEGVLSNSGISDNCLISYIDVSDPNCVWFEKLQSKEDYHWENAVNKGICLNNIGFTGVDNGRINYEKDKITNEEFLRLFKESELKIDEGDLRLILNKVYGNNQIYAYDNNVVEEDNKIVSKLNGGFYQGFFRTDENYKVLPSNIGNGMSFEIVLKKTDFENDGKWRLNDKYPENKGMFLYIGTRAENKWWQRYTTTLNAEQNKNGYVIDGYVSPDYNSHDSLNDDYVSEYKEEYVKYGYLQNEYFDERCEEDKCCCKGESENRNVSVKSTALPIFTYPEFLNVYEDNSVWKTNDGKLWVENELETTNNASIGADFVSKLKSCDCNNYFSNGYIKDDILLKQCNCNSYFGSDYLKEDVFISPEEGLSTSDGYDMYQPNIREYRSDNKFLLFDRTKDGFTADDWVDCSETIITDIQTPDIENYFLLFNRTCNGYTTDSINELIEKESKKYDVVNDLYRNALGFQITDDGRIGYKYLVKNCNGESEYTIETEMSGVNAVTSDKWHTIAIKIIPIGKTYGDCVENTSPSDKMKFMIYVDGELRLVSKELPTLNLRKLNDIYSKQEGVPFNISVGGGTQGLSDVIYLNYRKQPEYALPLEKEFAGTFIGYFKELRIYDCQKSFSEIVSNSEFDGTF